MAIGKCIQCKKMVGHLKIESIEARGGIGGPRWGGINYLCPWCNTVLGAGIDPVALKADTVNEIIKALQKSR